MTEKMDGCLRLRLRACLSDALMDGASMTKDQATLMAGWLEMCAQAYARGKPDKALATVSRVVFNLKTNGAHILAHNPPSRVCRLTHQRMGAETAHALRDALVESQVKQLLQDAADAAAASQQRATQVAAAQAIRCPNRKCGTQDGILRMTQQSRAADEGMTTVCVCIKCGQRWKLA